MIGVENTMPQTEKWHIEQHANMGDFERLLCCLRENKLITQEQFLQALGV